uniref:ATP synthase subunit gamma, mitochondrial n=1 Tax=Vitis vinifera TaxID=29760 RepID=A5BAY5_VITVI|nr:hypothetical protein VITISV_014454 [Vitis vinifera]
MRGVQGFLESSRNLLYILPSRDISNSSFCFFLFFPSCFNQIVVFQVSVLADEILKNVEYDALRIVFNKFRSIISFVPTTSTVLSPEVVEREAEAGGKLGDLDSYEIEGGETKGEILQNLAEFQFSCVLFNAVLENACSEQGARMSAMDSSSRNAGDMLDRLTLTYNRTRQAAITTELTEIISGASALEG